MSQTKRRTTEPKRRRTHPYPLGGNTPFQSKYKHCYPTPDDRPRKEGGYSYWTNVLFPSAVKWCLGPTTNSLYRMNCVWTIDKLRLRSTSNLFHDTIKDVFVVGNDDLCYLVVNDQRLLAHKTILSFKSFKLAAAIRFAANQQQHNVGNSTTSSSNIKPIEIRLDISFEMACFLIQHCYHGSIFCGLSAESTICCHELLELSLVAEEFLCPSLVLECEMRLLSSKPRHCFCWYCCDKIVTATPSVNDDNDDDDTTEKYQCCYRCSSPSCLINANTAMSTLAISQEHFSSPKESFVRVMLDAVNDGGGGGGVGTSYPRPFGAVEVKSMRTILQEFRKVLESDGYLVQLHYALEEQQRGARNLVEEEEDNYVGHEESFALYLLDKCLNGLLESSLSLGLRTNSW